ncbi:MAG: DUF2345 domain-containing protein, partial [Cytophaga sp.]|nr:DUF2345 domain-containing protein [Undibacterium sp.]
AQGNHHHAVKAGISLFTYGKLRKDAKEEPNTETGIKLHAATGKVSTQSQSDKTSITADKTITVASTNKTIMIAAQKHVLLTAMGAFLKLEAGDITIAAPGKVEFKASMKELSGAASSSPNFLNFPQSDFTCAQKFQLKDTKGRPMKDESYTIYATDEQEIKGKTDAAGLTSLIDTKHFESTYIVFDRDLQWVCEEVNDDEDMLGC